MLNTDGYILDKLMEASNHFALATSINLIIFDRSGNIIYETSSRKSYTQADISCAFCEALSDSRERGREKCRKTHINSVTEAKRFGGRYVYFCHSKLAHFVSPLIVNDEVVFSVMSEPFLLIEKDEYFETEILPMNISDKKKEYLYGLLGDIKFIKSSKVHALSELLFAGVEYVSKVYLKNDDFGIQRTYKTDDDESGENRLGVYFTKEQDLIKAMHAGDIMKARELLNDILGEVFFQSGYRYEIIKLRVVELSSLLSRAAIRGGADSSQVFSLDSGYLSEIDKLRTIEEIAVWLSVVMNRFMGAMFDFSEIKNKDIIKRALDYIKANYNKKISLETVANHVYLSPTYFSKLFKEEMKINFSVYLCDLRIERSKELLTDGNYDLVTIAQMTGFEDQSYFTKVFKKKVLIPPGKFRRMGGLG